MKDPAASGGESDPSERPEAQSPIIQKNRNRNEQASGRPIETGKKVTGIERNRDQRPRTILMGKVANII